MQCLFQVGLKILAVGMNKGEPDRPSVFCLFLHT